jgi:hypothetical protein
MLTQHNICAKACLQARRPSPPLRMPSAGGWALPVTHAPSPYWALLAIPLRANTTKSFTPDVPPHACVVVHIHRWAASGWRLTVHHLCIGKAFAMAHDHMPCWHGERGERRSTHHRSCVGYMPAGEPPRLPAYSRPGHCWRNTILHPPPPVAPGTALHLTVILPHLRSGEAAVQSHRRSLV